MTRAFVRQTATSGKVALTLICFAHAGGGCGRFRGWAKALGGGIEVLAMVLPGRERRINEEPLDDLATIARQVVLDLDGHIDGPFALAGISFGALLAFEVAGLLEERAHGPLGLFVASQRAPHAVARPRLWHTLNDEALTRKLVEIGGLDAADTEFLEVFLGTIRADLRASETYRPPAQARLRCPILVCRGRDDPAVSAEDVENWRTETSEKATLRTLTGGHFLMQETSDLWLASIVADIATVVPSGTVQPPAHPVEAYAHA